MKKLTITIALFVLVLNISAQDGDNIRLNPPDLSGRMNVMEAFQNRQSASEFDTEKLNLQDLSDLLWAANGINRPDNGKRTAPSAINAQDIDIYVIMESGAYLYDASKLLLKLVTPKDLRKLAAGRQENMAKAPLICLLVSDISKFTRGSDSLKLAWAGMDAGIVSQNISIYCAGAGLSTRPRATMDSRGLRDALKLTENQYPLLNNPVSYKKK